MAKKFKNINDIKRYMENSDALLVRDLNRNIHYVINYDDDKLEHIITEELFLDCFDDDSFHEYEYESDDNVFEFRYYE